MLFAEKSEVLPSDIEYPTLVITWMLRISDIRQERLTIEKTLEELRKYITYNLFKTKKKEVEHDDLLKCTFKIIDSHVHNHLAEITFGYSNSKDAVKAKFFQENHDLYWHKLLEYLNKEWTGGRSRMEDITSHRSLRIIDFHGWPLLGSGLLLWPAASRVFRN